MHRASLIYNPAAGRFPSRLLADRVIKLLDREGWNVSLESSSSGEHISELARQAAQNGKDAVFVMGGDGSLNHAIKGLLNTSTALGVLPAGTANVWAQEIGLPTMNWTRWDVLRESISYLARGQVLPVDIGLCNGYPFLLWAGIGLDGYIVNRIEPRNRWAKSIAIVHYGASAIWYARQWHGLKLHVEIDGKPINGHYLLALASNIRLYAGGLIHLVGEKYLDDGLMDLWLLAGENFVDTLQRVWDLFMGKVDRSEEILRFQFKHLTLECDSPLFVQLDGEPLQIYGKVEIRLLPKGLNVLVPSNFLGGRAHQ
jgi:YegS/Rv2252/BmrU family lipid kinase